jgi:hypothetical protein
MAAALVPLIPALAPLAPSIIDLIVSLVHHKAPEVEAANGPGTGPVKFADLFGTVIDSLTKAATAGQIDKTLPADDTIKLIMQAAVTSMQKMGMLGSTATATGAPNAGGLTLHPGQSLTISLAAA